MTPETLKNPTAKQHPDPIDLEAAIERVRCMVEELPWLEKSFGRAREHAEKNPDGQGGEITVPKVYQGKKEYYPVLPNDSLRSYSFFRVAGNRVPDDYTPDNISYNETTPVDLIVWGNLQKIDKHKDYIFTEELIRDVRSVLRDNGEVFITQIADERPEDIFVGYTLDPTQQGLLKYPYFAFRIGMNLRYSSGCVC